MSPHHVESDMVPLNKYINLNEVRSENVCLIDGRESVEVTHPSKCITINDNYCYKVTGGRFFLSF